jgi:hypothetical protein
VGYFKTFYKKLLKVNNHPMAENSLNLVTIFVSLDEKLFRLFVGGKKLE